MKRTSHPNASAVGQETTAPIAPGVEWVRPGDVRTRYGLGRSLLYELIKSGEVHSVSLRRTGRATGCRLVSAASLRAYIAGHGGKTL
jgi:hypothetical protein